MTYEEAAEMIRHISCRRFALDNQGDPGPRCGKRAGHPGKCAQLTTALAEDRKRGLERVARVERALRSLPSDANDRAMRRMGLA